MSQSTQTRARVVGKLVRKCNNLRTRQLANLRERKRMILINKAFDCLKQKLFETQSQIVLGQQQILPLASPNQLSNDCMQQGRKCKKLTKVQILNLAICYIKSLQQSLRQHPAIQVTIKKQKESESSLQDDRFL